MEKFFKIWKRQESIRSVFGWVLSISCNASFYADSSVVPETLIDLLRNMNTCYTWWLVCSLFNTSKHL